MYNVQWFDAVYNADLEYIKKHSKNVHKVIFSYIKSEKKISYYIYSRRFASFVCLFKKIKVFSIDRDPKKCE